MSAIAHTPVLVATGGPRRRRDAGAGGEGGQSGTELVAQACPLITVPSPVRESLAAPLFRRDMPEPGPARVG